MNDDQIDDQIIEKKLYNFLEKIKIHLPKEYIKEIEDYISYREWGLAFEGICASIFEYKIPISPEFYKQISEFGKLLDCDSDYCLQLRKLVVNDN